MLLLNFTAKESGGGGGDGLFFLEDEPNVVVLNRKFTAVVSLNAIHFKFFEHRRLTTSTLIVSVFLKRDFRSLAEKAKCTSIQLLRPRYGHNTEDRRLTYPAVKSEAGNGVQLESSISAT